MGGYSQNPGHGDGTKQKKKKPLWECPVCAQQFVTRNMSHSCGHHTIDEHFAGKPPEIRRIFDELLRAVRRFGRVHVYAQKTRIVFQTRGRFVAITPRKQFLGGHIWLKRRRAHSLVYRIESLLDRDFVHNFRLTGVGEMDEIFCDMLREAYSVGSQDFDVDGEKKEGERQTHAGGKLKEA